VEFIKRMFCKHDFGEEAASWHQVPKQRGSRQHNWVGAAQARGGQTSFQHFSCKNCGEDRLFSKLTAEVGA